jgi:AraC family transcriptional regulator
VQYSGLVTTTIVRRRPSARLSHSFDEVLGEDAVSRQRLLDLPIGLVEDVRHSGPSPARGTEGFSGAFQVCLPYRGLFVWHVGREDVVGDANHVILVTGGEDYRLSNPLSTGYAELIITPEITVLSEMMQVSEAQIPRHQLFRQRSWSVDPRVQVFRTRFLYWAHRRVVDDLEAEEGVLALLQATLQAEVSKTDFHDSTKQLVRRTKEFLEADYVHHISLTDVGRIVGASPAYLTDVFHRTEGIPLHQYLMRLRLARALVELPHADNLTSLALDLGFSSHSHFSAVFRHSFGLTPSQFRESTRRGVRPLTV